MAIISQETFDKFSEEEKDSVRKEYLKWQEEAETNPYFEGKISNMEELFDKENLQPKPKIKTWEDVVENNPNYNFQEYLDSITEGPGMVLGISPICKKMIATYKIAKLIEMGYGGMITNEEWKDDNVAKYAISTCVINDKILNIKQVDIYSYHSEKYFVAFHTPEQREAFMSYPENRKLVEQYYMI